VVSRRYLEAAMVLIYKHIKAHHQWHQQAAAALDQQRPAGDGIIPAQRAGPDSAGAADPGSAASVHGPEPPARDGWADALAGSRPDGQAAKAAQAVGREPAAQAQDRVSRAPAIQVRGLRKSYGSAEAVAGVDLEVYAGEVFAFLGPNGAGKTTTVEILEGYRRRSAGDVSVLGADPATAGRAWRARIGVVLQEAEPEAELTAGECLSMYAGYYGRPRPVAETLDLVGLTGQRATRCGQMSGGQRRRLDVALALIGDPELIFLDEPTTGFDPAARQSAWAVIAGLRDLGKTIFLTTHYMEEAEELADRIAVLAAGQIVAQGSPATLGGRDTEASVISFTLPPDVPVTDLPPAVAACVTRTAGGHLEAETPSPGPLLATLGSWAEARHMELPDLQVHRHTLEDIYLQLTRESR
jgi:ABC-2 type transport system ATP-binding protein